MFQNLYSNPDFSVVYSNFTIILYYVIVLLSFICGYYIQYSYSQETKLILYNKRFFLHFHVNLFVLLFFLVSFISGVREIGNDYVNYIDIFERSNSLDRFFIGVEPGFIIYNGIIRFFTSNYYVFFLITSFLTVALFYISIVRYSEYVELSLAFGAYACVFYFQSFSLVRIYLASAILFYGTKYLFNQQNVKFFLIIVFAITIHTSSIFILLTFILYLLKCRSDRMFYILYVSIFLCSILLKDYLMILNISDRYSGYLENMYETPSVGFGVLVVNVPLFYYLLKLKYLGVNEKLYNIFMVYICMSFFVSFMGYYIPTIARANVHFTIPLLVLLPYYVHELKKKKLPYKGTYMIIIIYLLCRLHIYFSEYLYVDEIMPYKTFFN